MSFQEVSHRRDRWVRRDYLIFFSAISAVNSYVSFLIRLVAFQTRGCARIKGIVSSSGYKSESVITPLKKVWQGATIKKPWFYFDKKIRLWNSRPKTRLYLTLQSTAKEDCYQWIPPWNDSIQPPLGYLSQEQMQNIHSTTLQVLGDHATVIHHQKRKELKNELLQPGFGN